MKSDYMIRHLYVKNFVLIDEIHLDFENGFSVFTGETGAGKSILIDAISLLCAERASASFVMSGKDTAIVEGTFDLTEDTHARNVLEEAGFECGEETTFTREIHANGKSAARIDHRIVTLSLMRDCLRDEIDIHGQRDNAYLLNTSSHIRLLDEFLNDSSERDAVKEAYDEWNSLVQEKERALNEKYNETDLEYFRYQKEEIENADLKPGEDEELQAKERQYKAVKDSYEKLNAVFSAYDESVSGDLYEMNRIISSLKSDDTIEEIKTAFTDAYYEIQDAVERLRDVMDGMDLSEEDINEMEERLYTIQKLKRKYGTDIEGILARKEELEHEINMFTHRQEYLDGMQKKIDAAFKKYEKKAAVLSKIRKDRAPELDKAIAANLKELMLPNARFHTELTPSKPSALGSEKAEFLISMNKGEELKPLSRTASGGELSRLMLGLKVIFTSLQGIQTVIFDEIDTGVSGAVASRIGMEMKKLSGTCQVFSVTHLAPVAAYADSHYLVLKSDDETSTKTGVKLLDENETINELARIASGEVTEISRRAAEELYARSHS